MRKGIVWDEKSCDRIGNIPILWKDKKLGNLKKCYKSAILN